MPFTCTPPRIALAGNTDFVDVEHSDFLEAANGQKGNHLIGRLSAGAEERSHGDILPG
jgi:hypothetical protein